MTASLGDHYSETLDENTYRFVLSTIAPRSNRTELVAALTELMARNKSDPEVTRDLLEAAGWTTAVAAFRKGRVSVRRGDFGEMLAAEAAEAFNDMVVPVRKLRYQIDPNQTLPGNDVVAFLLDDAGSIEELEFIESKYRTDPPIDTAVVAHDQLAADRASGYATTLNFIANRLKESQPTLYTNFMRFLSSRNVKDSTHTVALSFDKTNWDDRIAEDLDDLPAHLPDLWLRIFPTDDAVDLIDEVYDGLLWDAIDDE